MLDFRDSGQEVENDGFDKDFKTKCYGFEALDECWILARRWKIIVFIRISIRKCYGFEALGECWISGILVMK